MNIISKIETCQICRLQRTEEGKAEAEPILHDPVNILRFRNPFLDQRDGLTPERML